MPPRLLSLAAGTVLDVPPAQIADVAAAAGFAAVGLWFDPETWSARTTRDVAASLRSTGVRALDIEPIILGRGTDPGERLVDTAMELGVDHVLVASGPASRPEVVERLGTLLDRIAGSQVTLVLEFLPIFTVDTLAAACSIVEEVASSQLGVLVDTLHLARSGGTAADLAAFDSSLFPYLQLADAESTRPAEMSGLREEALHGRLLPGDGVLPLGEMLDAVPDVPVSVELRSRALNERFPDPVDRARAVREASERVMAHR